MDSSAKKGVKKGYNIEEEKTKNDDRFKRNNWKSVKNDAVSSSSRD